jgi:hypothetical protein
MASVFFSPFASTWLHTEIELAEIKKKESLGEESLILSCNRSFNFYCHSMSAFGLDENSSDEKKIEICNRCIKSNSFREEYVGVKTEFIDTYLTKQDLKDIMLFKNSLNLSQWESIKFDGIKVGKFSAYEIFLRYKVINSNLDTKLLSYINKQIEYCALVVRIANNFFKKNDIQSSYVYNDLYALNKTFQEVARINGVRTYSLHAAGPLNDLYSRYSVDTVRIKHINASFDDKWSSYKHRPLSINQCLRVIKIVVHQVRAKSYWTYSKESRTLIFRSKIREILGIKNKSKIILLTLSSQDEIFAERFVNEQTNQKNDLDQFTILEDLVKFCDNNTEYFVIVRIHPREYPNKRESVTSANAQKIEAFFKDTSIPTNLKLVTPRDNLSIHQLMLISEYVYNNLSSVGLEASLFGIPVLSKRNSLFNTYPEEFNNYIKGDDLNAIDLENIGLLSSEKRIELTRLSFRWLHFKHFVLTEDKYYVRSKFYYLFLRFLKRVYLKNSNYLDNKLFRNLSFRALQIENKSNYRSSNDYKQRRNLNNKRKSKIFSNYYLSASIERFILINTIRLVKRYIFLIYN